MLEVIIRLVSTLARKVMQGRSVPSIEANSKPMAVEVYG